MRALQSLWEEHQICGKAVDMTWRSTNVWRKENGTWKIIHAHCSVPVDMATGKADMQSKP